MRAKGKLGTPASRPTAAQRGETERFILWARDGSRTAEIEVPLFRPRAEVLLWKGRSFIWHEKTRRYVEAVTFVVTKKSKRQSHPAENSFTFDSGEPDT